jgi:hypothetical protein
MAEIGREFYDAGLDLDPKLLIAEMKNRMAQQTKTLFGSLKGEALWNAIGEDIGNELLAFKVAQLQATKKVEPLTPPDPVPAANSDEENVKIERPTKYLRNMKEFLSGK